MVRHGLGLHAALVDVVLPSATSARVPRQPMVACLVCSSEETRVRWSGLGDRLFRTTDERFDVHRCGDCGAHFLWPIPGLAQLARYYPDDYWVGPSDRQPGRTSQ